MGIEPSAVRYSLANSVANRRRRARRQVKAPSLAVYLRGGQAREVEGAILSRTRRLRVTNYRLAYPSIRSTRVPRWLPDEPTSPPYPRVHPRPCSAPSAQTTPLCDAGAIRDPIRLPCA